MHKSFYIFSVFMLLLTACAKEEVLNSETETNANPIELAGIRVSIGQASGETRTASTPTGIMPSALKDSIGRYAFDSYDQLVFTTIRRTVFPLTKYSYDQIKFNHNSGSWVNANSNDKIYWSDGASGHTFIGYCLPHKTTGAAVTEGDDKNFDWDKIEDVYYGSIGNPSEETEVINYNETETIDNVAVPQNLLKEDLLLTHDEDIKNLDGDPNANIVCHHALASVRVTVSITGFSTSNTDKDSESKVSNLQLDSQPVMYKWDQQGYGVKALTEADATNQNLWNQKKTLKLWQPQPDGVGTGSGRSFTFYGINVPGTYDVPISFSVSYPDPLNPSGAHLQNTYRAQLSELHFKAGFCTSITITLNHKNEEITIGAEYMSWEYHDSPDEGSLFKNTTYLESVDRNKITLMGDKDATADDATWLYVDADGTIKDIYGHTGTESDPFQISTAYQLLSFAYEVKGNQGRLKDRTGVTSITVKEAPNSSTTKTLNASSGFDFKNYHIRLDADLTLQKATDKTKTEKKNEGAEDGSGAEEIVWPGIGDESHAFEGNLMAKVRNISRLYGNPFFINIGPNARVCQLIMEHVIQINGDGGLAAVNNGVICACKVDGKVVSTHDDSSVGSLAGTNKGLIFACYHIGDVTGPKNVGGLIGDNQGYLVACYNMGKITAGSGYTAYAVAATAKANRIFGCFYDITKAGVLDICPSGGTAEGYPSQGKTTSEIIKPAFVGARNQYDTDQTNPSLNGIINKWSALIPTGGSYTNLREHLATHYYDTQAASYPYVW